MESLGVAMANLTIAMAALAIKSAEIQGKFDAFIRLWNDWIGNRGGENDASLRAV